MFSRLLVLACSLLVSAPAVAQSVAPVPPLPAAEDSHVTFKSGVDLVTLNVTVTDAKNQHVPGLREQDFQVLEDGVPQNLTFFAAQQVPLDVALLIDTSSSMREKLDFVHQAATRFVRTLKPGDRGEIVAFSNKAEVLQPFTEDHDQLEAAIRYSIARGATALYTAIYVTLDQFMHMRNEAVRRPAIVVLTDGQDTTSLIQFDDLMERARRAGVAIYSISVISPFDAKVVEANEGRRFIDESDFALKSLAQETGARAFFPLQLAELNGVYESVASELSTQYALGYAPRSDRGDGMFHRILVRVLSRPDARSRTRTGYYSPRATASLRTR